MGQIVGDTRLIQMWCTVDSTNGGTLDGPLGKTFTAAFNSDSSATDYTVPDITTKDEIGIDVFVKYDGITPDLPVTSSADHLWMLIVTTLVLVSGSVTSIIRTKRRREQNIAELKNCLNKQDLI